MVMYIHHWVVMVVWWCVCTVVAGYIHCRWWLCTYSSRWWLCTYSSRWWWCTYSSCWWLCTYSSIVGGGYVHTVVSDDYVHRVQFCHSLICHIQSSNSRVYFTRFCCVTATARCLWYGLCAALLWSLWRTLIGPCWFEEMSCSRPFRREVDSYDT